MEGQIKCLPDKVKGTAPFQVLIPTWVGLCSSRTPCDSPANSPVRLGVSSAAASTSTDFCRQTFWVFSFPMVKPWAFSLVLLPNCSSQLLCTEMWDHPQSLLTCHSVLSAPVSTPPTSLDECFFNSLVVGLPCSLISGSSGCFLFLNWLLPSFGCMRKRSVSAYASISSGTPWSMFLTSMFLSLSSPLCKNKYL